MLDNCFRFAPRDSIPGLIAKICKYLKDHPGWSEAELENQIKQFIGQTSVESFNGRNGAVVLNKDDVNNLKIASAYFAEGNETIDKLDLVSLYNQGVRFVFTDFNSVTSGYNLAFVLDYFDASGEVVYYPVSTGSGGSEDIVSVNGKTGEVHLKVVDVSNGNSPDENAYIFIDESDDYPDVISSDSSKLGGQLPSYYASAEEVSQLKDDLDLQRLIIPISNYGGSTVDIDNANVIMTSKPSSVWGLYVFNNIKKVTCNYSTNQYILLAYRIYSDGTFDSTALCLVDGQYYGRLITFFVNSYKFDSTAQSGIPSFDLTKLTVTNNGDGTFILSDETNTYNLDISQRPDVVQSSQIFCIGGVTSNYYSANTVMQSIYNTYSDAVIKVDEMIDEKIASRAWYKGMMGACIGDSITEQATYINTFKSILGLASLYNYGVSGTSIAKRSESDTSAFCVRVDSMNLDDVTLITVMGGTNDYGLNIPLGSQTDTSLTTFYGALKYTIEKLVTLRPLATIIVITPTKRNYSSDPSSGINSAGHTLKDYRDAMLNICETYSIPVLDLWAESGMNTINLSSYTVDGLHWNSNMGVKMGKTMAEFVIAHPKVT